MTKEELTTKIHHGLQTLRAMSASPDPLDPDPVRILEAAQVFGDRMAGSRNMDEANAIATESSAGRAAFLAVADVLDIEDVSKVSSSSQSSIANTHALGAVGTWLAASVRADKMRLAFRLHNNPRP